MNRAVLAGWLLAGAWLTLSACESPPDSDSESGVDGSPESSVDDSAVDGAQDTTVESSSDSALDTTVESSSDSAQDTTVESSSDSALDTTVESSTDGASDSTVDGSGSDAAFDGGGDGAPDAPDGGIIPPTVSTACNGEGWCKYLPYPIGQVVSTVWESSATDVWASSSSGTYHFDGADWTRYPFMALKLSGTASNDVWAVEGVDPILLSVVTSSIRHWNGSAWTSVVTPFGNVRSVWARTPTDVWISGGNGIARYNGSTWTTWSFLGNAEIFGFGANDVWFAVNNGVVQFNGAVWTDMNAPTGLGHAELWGTVPTDVWLCTENAGIQRFNGSTWTQVLSGGYPHCSGRGANDIVFAGSGTSRWWDGTQFSTVTSATAGFAVFGGPTEYVFGRGQVNQGTGSLLHGTPPGGFVQYVGGDSSVARPIRVRVAAGQFYSPSTGEMSTGPGLWTAAPGGALAGVQGAYATSPTFVVATSPGLPTGTKLSRYNGVSWSTMTTIQTGINAVWGSSATDFWAVGTPSYHWDGNQWSALGPTQVLAVTGSGSNDVWFSSGTSLVHWDGVSFTTTPIPALKAPINKSGIVAAIASFASNDAWFVGTYGDVYHWNGSAWSAAGTCGYDDILSSGWGASGHLWLTLKVTNNGISIPPYTIRYHYDHGTCTAGEALTYYYPANDKGATVAGIPGSLWSTDMETGWWLYNK